MASTPNVSTRMPHFSIYGEGLDQFTGVRARSEGRRRSLEELMLRKHGAKPLYRINVRRKDR